LEEVRERAAAEGKRFAVIADEAHSSQRGGAAAGLRQVLSPEEIEDVKDGGEVSTEDILASQMATQASEKGITYVAFYRDPQAQDDGAIRTTPKGQ
jgi:type I restriction enzyme, R subunit